MFPTYIWANGTLMIHRKCQLLINLRELDIIKKLEMTQFQIQYSQQIFEAKLHITNE